VLSDARIIQLTTIRPYSQVLDRLRGAGLRPTRQRLALAKLLFDGRDRHLTAEKLHAEAMAAKIGVSLATVYNTLHQFTDTGMLREITVDASCSHFDTNTSEHHHFYYEASGRLEDIAGDKVAVTELPTAPAGTSVKRVDVIVRLQEE
jgi:Fur family iron response transcriptional regulator